MMAVAAQPLADRPVWRPTAAEVEQIVLEMRPIIQQFARRAARDLANAS